MNDEVAPKGQFSSMNPVDFGQFFLWDPHPRWIPVKPEVRSLILGYRVSASVQICWVVSCAICNWLVVWNMAFMTFHILGIIIPIDFDIFQRGWNHQPDNHIHISAFHEQQLFAVACHSKKLQTWPSSQSFTWPRFQPPQMVAGADTVGTQKGTPWNAWWNGENWALRQVWPIIQTPGYIYIYIYIYILYWII